MRHVAVLVLLFFFPMAVHAADAGCVAQDYANFNKEPDWSCPAPGEDALVPKLEIANATVSLSRDAKAPYTGMLLDQNRVVQLGLRIQGLRHLLWIQAKQDQEFLEVEVAHVTNVAKLDLQATTAQRDNFRNQVTQLNVELERRNAWYRSWTFGLVLGVVLTTAASVSLAFALH